MKKNIGTRDRLIRLALATIILVYAWWKCSYIAFAASAFVYFESFMSWCVVYALLGKSSCPIKRKK